MGLDIVELVMQVEEKFSITLPDDELQRMQMVGDLYRLVLDKLNIPYEPSPKPDGIRLGRGFLLPRTAVEVWGILKTVIIEQLQVGESEVVETASFQNDLGAD